MSEGVPETTEKTTPSKDKEKKVREVDGYTKRDLMDAVQDLIKGSRIVKAKVWNPYEDVATDGVVISTIKATPGTPGLPATIPDTIVSYASMGMVDRRTFGLEKAETGKPTGMSEEEFRAERERRRRAYVRWGVAEVSTFAAGNCSCYAAVTLGLLASEAGLAVLPRDAVVELFGFKSSDGHAFLVVNRKGGELAKPATWGPDAFVIDQWFARQRKETPGSYAVKDVTGKEGDKYYDAFFNKFISVAMRGPTAFTHALLSDPRDPV